MTTLLQALSTGEVDVLVGPLVVGTDPGVYSSLFRVGGSAYVSGKTYFGPDTTYGPYVTDSVVVGLQASIDSQGFQGAGDNAVGFQFHLQESVGVSGTPVGHLNALAAEAEFSGTGSTNHYHEMRSVYSAIAITGATAVVDEAWVYEAAYYNKNPSTATLATLFLFGAPPITPSAGITNLYGLSLFQDPGAVTQGVVGAATNQYGVYVADVKSAMLNYAIYTNAGQVSLGDSLNVRAGGVGIAAAPVDTNVLVVGSSYLWSNPVSANGYQRYGVGYGIYWNSVNANYTVTDPTNNQSTFTQENGTFVWAAHSGALTNPRTYAQWTAYNLMLLDTSGNLTLGGHISTNDVTLMHTRQALTNGSGAQTATLTNAPAAGNPTKWVPIDDNGTTRYIPAW